MKHLSTLLSMLMLCAGTCWAETSTLTFTAACRGSGTADDGVAWTVTSDAAESTFESNRGIHYGTGSAAVSHLTLTTNGISGTITEIKVNAAGASGTSAKLNVTVGGAAFGSEQSLTATATPYTLTGSASGTIVVTLSQTSAKRALYVKSIAVTYSTSGSGGGGDDPIDDPTGDGTYELVTNASTLADGDLIIITSSKNDGDAYAMGPQTNANYRDQAPITIADKTTTPGSGVQILTLEGTSGAWYFNTGSGYLYASSNSSNYLGTETTKDDNAKATIVIDSDTHEATIVFQGNNSRNNIRYNAQNTRFSCYDGETTNLPLVYIFRKKTEQPLTTVTGLSELKQQEPGTTVRLSLPDGCNARVLTVHGTDTYVRDNSGAIVFHGDMLPTRNLKYNQHLAGWIVGKYSVNETTGMPQFEPVEGKTNTAFLVIADPVTEATTEATAITADEYDSHLADWVAVNDVRVGGGVAITDGLEKGYATPYDGALVDLSAIVAGTAIDGKDTYFPLEQNGLADVTYVVDAKKEFVKPDDDLNDVAVRYKRTFAANVWTPLTLPFDLDDFDGKVMEFSGLEQGEPVTSPMSGSLYAAGNMLFTQASGIEAGKPYLVKPNNDITVMTFGATTLSSAEPQRITHTIAGTRANGPKRIGQVGEYDEYSFVGVYTPTTLNTDRSQRFMDEAGGVDWVDGSSVTVDGTTAYFEVPTTQGVHLKFADDTSEPIITVVDDLTRDSMAQRPTGIYNLLGVKMRQSWSDLPRGIYIVNGKKVVK
ncbi:MAG: hypothetical protein IJ632_01970 [Muribaculaceae bacterium]|nr:hypothetical protein [Muribaculaceae bacterium]